MKKELYDMVRTLYEYLHSSNYTYLQFAVKTFFNNDLHKQE